MSQSTGLVRSMLQNWGLRLDGHGTLTTVDGAAATADRTAVELTKDVRCGVPHLKNVLTEGILYLKSASK